MHENSTNQLSMIFFSNQITVLAKRKMYTLARIDLKEQVYTSHYEITYM